MKVILLQDVARIGKRFEVVNVPDGHALNMLIPKRMAEPATPVNLKRLDARSNKIAADKSAAAASFAEVSEKLKDSTQVMAMEVNDQGHLFQGVKAENVAAHLTEAGFAVEAGQVQLSEVLKEAGDHEITVSDGEHTSKFTLKIEAK